MKNIDRKRLLLILIVIAIIMVFGITYAYFKFYQEGSNGRLLTADLYLDLSNNQQIMLTDVFPETKESARSRNDNKLSFSISGRNTSSDDIHYEIILVYGDDEAEPMKRFNDRDILFDLIEVGENEVETLILDAVSFDDINGRKIWVGTVEGGTNENITKTYKIRAWLSESVLVSDTDPNANYEASTFKNRYANIKVAVYGDMEEKSFPLKSIPVSVVDDNENIQNGLTYFTAHLTNDYKEEDAGEVANDEIILYVTNPEGKVLFNYYDDESNLVEDQEKVSLSFNYTVNEEKTKNIYIKSKTDANVTTNIQIKLMKNGKMVQEFNKQVRATGSNYCLNNGFTRLYDCLLISNSTAASDDSVELESKLRVAKERIAAKGAPDVNKTAPVYTDSEGTIINEEASTEQGLYKVADDYGDSYIFRGVVNNNNVYFGGYYWKIIRTNGDGTIRMIYNGTSLDSSGNLNKGNAVAINGTTYAFNSAYAGPAYVGYMYDENATSWESGTTTYVDWGASTAYYWASSIDDFDELTDTIGTYWKPKSNATLIPATLTDVDLSSYSYTCKSTSRTGTCRVLFHVISKSNSTSAQVKYITVAARSKEAAQTNTKDSNAKKTLESWYKNTFSTKNNNGKKVTTYLADAYFCNDRSITDSTYNSGYSVTTHTFFAARKRLYNEGAASRTATLHCANRNDAFTVNDNIYGNSKLTYPVGLITADEVALAGGKYGVSNSKYYLHTNSYYWTLSPFYFDSTYASAGEVFVYPSGSLVSNFVTGSRGLRAVINLKSDVLITEGDGTVDSPYKIDLPY